MDRAAYVSGFQKCKSVMMDSNGIAKFADESFFFSGMQESEEPAVMRNLISPQEVLFALGCRDYATSVPTEKVHYSMNLESVLGYGIKGNDPFTNRTGSTMSVNFEVTDTKLAILSVHKDCGNGSMVMFTPDGRVKNCE